MEQFILKRSEIQDEIKVLTQKSQNINMVKSGMMSWLEDKQVSQFEAQQIMNDLTSYKEYLNLLN